MNLVGKILATTGLGVGLLFGCSTVVKNEKENEILKEEKNYETLFYRDFGFEVILGWDRNGDNMEDLRCDYIAMPINQNIKLLALINSAEDKNTNGIFEKDEYTNENEEYSKFFLGVSEGGLFLWRNNENGTNNRIYYYKIMGYKENEREACLKLISIENGTNEFLWKSDELKKSEELNKNNTNQDDIEKEEIDNTNERLIFYQQRLDYNE